MRSVHGDKLRCINYSMLCKVRSFRCKVNNTQTYSLSLLLLCPRTVVCDFPARVFRPSAVTSNTRRFKQTLSNPGWRVMHTVRSPMASSMTSVAKIDLFAANALLRFCNKADRAVRARTPAK